MRCAGIVLTMAALCLTGASGANAQFGGGFFKKPSIASVFKPVVGSGGLYEVQKKDQDGRKEVMEITVVGQENVDGKEAYWIEIGHTDENSGAMGYGKYLITKGDFQMQRMIVQKPNEPAMEMPVHANARRQEKLDSALDKWHETGTETITVPAGTFSCHHWARSDGKGEVWVSDKVSPLGTVKEVQGGETQVLVKVITGAKDHITGPVKKFDMQEMMRKAEQEREKRKQP